MPTPDLSEYISLAFFDKDPQDIFETGMLDLRSKLPGWQPREGNIEVLLLEAMAVQVAEAIFAANRIPDAVVMAVLRLAGVEPDEGAQPVATLQFQVSTTLGAEVPAGTQVLLELPGGLLPIRFVTTEALTIPAGSQTGTITAYGDRFTDEGNSVAAGTLLTVLDSLAQVDSASLASLVSGGRDPESDEMWIDRAVQRLFRLSETLVLPRHFEIAAVEDPSVVRSRVLDNWNGSTGAPGDHPGFVTVAVYGDGVALSAAAKEAVRARLDVAAAANLQVVVVDPSVTSVNVTTTVVADSDADPAAVKASVEQAIRDWLSPSTWDWDTVVRRNELIAVIGRAPGVAYVSSLTPSGDTALSGRATLARAGTVSVTVQ